MLLMVDALPRLKRSGLTMPIVTERFINNAWHRGCDFINMDLEDSVPPRLKDAARNSVKQSIPVVNKGGADAVCRINHDLMEADLTAVVWPGMTQINYPKTEYSHEIRRMDEIITRLERERGIRPGAIEIGANIETAVGVANAYEIVTASPRVRDFGGASGYDMSRDLGVEMFVGFDQFVYGKGEVELAARAAGREPHAAPFTPNITGSVSDPDRAFAEADASRKCGFRIGGGLHPNVVEPQNRGFMPSEDEISDAQWVLQEYRQLAHSSETWRQIDVLTVATRQIPKPLPADSYQGRFRVIDRYEAARARELLQWRQRCQERDREKSEAMDRVRAAEESA
jgi:citrate lyase subunit beta/citryl-CoA lyase